MDIKFSVIIPSLNEEHYISHVLTSLKKQTFKNFEVFLVDTNSTDKTVAIANTFKKDFHLTIINSNVRNISRSRNLGALKATGNYLFFIDADNYIYPSFLSEMVKIITEHGYELIIPSIVPNSKKKRYKFSYKLANQFIKTSKKLNMPLSTGGNLVIKRKVFEGLHGFDETIFVGEDHDIVKRAHKKNVDIAFISSSKVVFSIRRLEKEGFSMLSKYLISTLYIVFFGKITRKIYNYQMGGDYFKHE